MNASISRGCTRKPLEPQRVAAAREVLEAERRVSRPRSPGAEVAVLGERVARCRRRGSRAITFGPLTWISSSTIRTSIAGADRRATGPRALLGRRVRRRVGDQRLDLGRAVALVERDPALVGGVDQRARLEVEGGEAGLAQRARRVLEQAPEHLVGAGRVGDAVARSISADARSASKTSSRHVLRSAASAPSQRAEPEHAAQRQLAEHDRVVGAVAERVGHGAPRARPCRAACARRASARRSCPDDVKTIHGAVGVAVGAGAASSRVVVDPLARPSKSCVALAGEVRRPERSRMSCAPRARGSAC